MSFPCQRRQRMTGSETVNMNCFGDEWAYGVSHAGDICFNIGVYLFRIVASAFAWAHKKVRLASGFRPDDPLREELKAYSRL